MTLTSSMLQVRIDEWQVNISVQKTENATMYSLFQFPSGLNFIHLVEYHTPTSPQLLEDFHIEVVPENTGEVTDIEACSNDKGAWVAVTVHNSKDPLNGMVVVYEAFNSEPLQELHRVLGRQMDLDPVWGFYPQPSVCCLQLDLFLTC